MTYGVPFQGSKNRICKRLIEALPPAEHFFDLFGGGGAVTHAALLNGKYKHVHYNEINEFICDGFKKAMNGEYKKETRWISREDFHKLKKTDFYAACCFSFGNNYFSYCYPPAIEPYKKACHYAVVLDEWSQMRELCPETWQSAYEAIKGVGDLKERRKTFQRAIVEKLKEINNLDLVMGNPLYKSGHWKRKNTDIMCLQNLERLERLQRLESFERLNSLECLQSLERLERLQSLENLESLERWERLNGLSEYPTVTISNKSYDEVEMPPNSLIYCDIPYKKTAKYKFNKEQFDHEKFYKWAKRQKNIFISEYDMPEGFKEVKSWEVSMLMHKKGGAGKVKEKLYTI